MDLYNLRFSATSQFKNKLERLAEVLGIVNPEKCLAEVLEKALDVALEKKAPVKGSSDRENLRALCRAHNLRAAEKSFGDSFIRKRISSGREKRLEESTG